MKRTKRKLVIFSRSQWERVCKCAKALKMKPATYLRNMSLHKEWKCYQGEDICFPLKIINHIGTDMNMIIRVAESTGSEYLEKLKELKTRFEEYRGTYRRYLSRYMNKEE